MSSSLLVPVKDHNGAVFLVDRDTLIEAASVKDASKKEKDEYESKRVALVNRVRQVSASFCAGRDTNLHQYYRLMVDTTAVYTEEEILVLIDRLLELLDKPGALLPPKL